jgi:hypothetical protein
MTLPLVPVSQSTPASALPPPSAKTSRRSLRNSNGLRTWTTSTPASVYHNIVKRYAGALGLTEVIPGICVHSWRVTAAAKALEHTTGLPRCQSGSGLRILRRRGCMIKRQHRSEDSLTFNVKYWDVRTRPP